MSPPPPVLMDELVEEVLLRLPPEEPAWLVRASAVCKPWRGILDARRFRRRYCEFHGKPPVLGFFQENASFVPASALLPVLPDRPHWRALDCRHGRALFATYTGRGYDEEPSDFTVLDPLTGHQHHMPFPVDGGLWFSAAVLCATQGCDHHGCEEGHFLVIFISADELHKATSARVYSSETGAWSEPVVFIPEPGVWYGWKIHVPSVLMGDAVYFDCEDIVKYQFDTRRLSMFEKPTDGDGTLTMAENGVLGFAAVVDATNLAMWSRETGPDGAMGWAKLRVIDLKRLLSDGAFFNSALLSGVAEGSQVIFVTTFRGCYMVDLKSGRARKVSCAYYDKVFPFTRFYIPAMEAACTGQEQ